MHKDALGLILTKTPPKYRMRRYFNTRYILIYFHVILYFSIYFHVILYFHIILYFFIFFFHIFSYIILYFFIHFGVYLCIFNQFSSLLFICGHCSRGGSSAAMRPFAHWHMLSAVRILFCPCFCSQGNACPPVLSAITDQISGK